MNKLLDQANKRALEYFRSGTDGKGLDHNALAFAIQALEKQVPKRNACKVRCRIVDF